MIALLALAGLLIGGLMLVDLVSMRTPERFGAEAVLQGDGPMRSQQTTVWRRKDTPPILKASAGLAILYGTLAFPGTLAPVVLTVLALRQGPVASEGWTALIAVIVAALSMSVALKTMRAGRLMLELTSPAMLVARRCLFFLGPWNVAVIVSWLIADLPATSVASIVLAYVIATLLVFATLIVASRVAAAFVESTKTANEIDS